MAITHGSVEILNTVSHTSDGLVVNTPDVQALPTALAALRGLTNFRVVDPVPTEEREVGSFVYKQAGEGEFTREYRVELVNVPVADAMWRAKAPSGDDVTVYFRETRTLTPDEMEAARVLADIQASRM